MPNHFTSKVFWSEWCAVYYEAIAIGLLLITDILLSILKGLP